MQRHKHQFPFSRFTKQHVPSRIHANHGPRLTQLPQISASRDKFGSSQVNYNSSSKLFGIFEFYFGYFFGSCLANPVIQESDASSALEGGWKHLKKTEDAILSIKN